MQISARSVLMSGMATLTASAIALTPVQALPRDVAVPAANAAVQQVPSQQLVDLLAAVQRLAPTGSGAASLVEQQAAPAAGLLAFPGLGNAIINAYNAIEFWVDYGVDVAAYAVGWVPFGWIIGDQIQIFYNSLIEPIARTITYNLGWWIGGSVSLLQAINNDILGSANAFIGFANAEINWGWGLLPPLPFPPPQIPYLPWFGLLQTQAAAVSADALAPEVEVQNAASNLVDAIYIPVVNTIDYGVNVLQAALAPIPLINIAGDQVSILWNSLAQPISNSVVFDLIDPVLNQPLNINSYLNGAYDVGATTVNSVIQTGINEANYFLGGLPFTASTQQSQLDRTAEVSSVPSIVKNTLAPQNKVSEAPRPLAEAAKTVRNVRTEIQSAFTERRSSDVKQVSDADAAGNDVVRARDKVGGPISKAISDVTKAARPGKSDNVAAEVAKAPTNVVKSIGDTARKVVKDVRQAAKGARDGAKDRPAADSAE